MPSPRRASPTRAKLIRGDCNGPHGLDGGAAIKFPKKPTWQWTAPNDTVSKAIDNLLWWRKSLKKYFAPGNSVLNAYESPEVGIFSQRFTLEIVRMPFTGASNKLVLTFIVSRDRVGRPTFSASGYEEAVFPLPYALVGRGYKRINESDILAIHSSGASGALGINNVNTALRSLGVEFDI